MRPTRSPMTPKSSWLRDVERALADRCRVHRIVPRDHFEQERRIGDRVGERPDLVEAGREGDEPVAAHGAVGRLDPDHAAQRRGLADRTARVGSQAQRREPCGNRGGRSTAGAARDAARVVRVAGRTERRVLGAGSHGELVEVRLADHDGAGLAQLRDDRCVVGRLPAVEDLRRARRGDATGAHVVLEGDRAPRREGPDRGRPPLRRRSRRPGRGPRRRARG